MPEEIGDKNEAPELTELEHSDLLENPSLSEPETKEVLDITVDHVMEPEQGVMMNNSCPPGEASCDIGDEITNLFKEEAGDFIRTDVESPESLTGKTSPLSTGKSSTVRKKGTVVIVGSNHKFNIQSRYLSSPIGSCHDSCKSGHHRESEKNISPTSGMIRRAVSMRTRSHDLSKSAPKEETQTKKKTFVRRLSLPSSIEEEDGEPSSVESNCSKKDLKKSKLTRLQSVIEPSSVPTPRLTSSRKSEIQPSKEVAVRNFNQLESLSVGIKAIKTSKEKGKEPATSSSLTPKTLVKKTPSMKARLYKNNKSLSHASKVSSSKEPKIDGVCDVPEKTLYMIEPGTEQKPAKNASRISLSSENLPSTSRGSRVGKSNASKANQKGNYTMKGRDSVNTKQMNTITEDSVSNAPPAKSPVRGGGSKPITPRAAKLNNLRAKSTKGHGGSRPNSARGDVGSKPSTPRTKPALERKMKAKVKVSESEGKVGPAWKVKFKKGTIVALQTTEGAPKKLLFKRGRILGDDQIAKDDVVRISKIRDRRGNEPRDGKQPESRKVRLRHQEASSKKETVDLNNVIEETVSQLVKTRKSKVQALVGAFETVMSLHDRKAVGETRAS